MRVPDGNGHNHSSADPTTLGSSSTAGSSSSSLDGFTNGHNNGIQATNGHNGVQKGSSKVARVVIPGTLLYEDMNIDREEYVRLVLQSLRDVGYTHAANVLEQESGYSLEAPDVAHFRESILSGMWSAAEAALERMNVSDTDGLMDAKFLIYRQKYLEMLESGKTTDALYVLRNQLAPLGVETEQLHTLSSLIMCSEPEDLRHRANWDGAASRSRQQLLAQLHNYIPASVMLPEQRMASLLQQSRLYQRQQCLYHSLPSAVLDFPLYSDHHCDPTSFPRTTTTILKGHTDEVWNIEWSHDGSYLASASSDKTAIIWKIGPELEPSTRKWTTHQVLRDHDYPVGVLSWSPDDSVLITSAENVMKIWNTRTGICQRTLDKHTDPVTSVAWFPDGSRFLSGGLDKRIIEWDSEGREVRTWDTAAIRITSLAVAPDLGRVVTVGMQSSAMTNGAGSLRQVPNSTPSGAAQEASENWLVVYSLATRQAETVQPMKGQMTSVKVSSNSQYALINHAPDELLLWDLDQSNVARKFTGQKQGVHVIRSCFGGVDGTFIVSGSEDGKVYVWHRDTGCLLEALSGHGDGSVNAVAWNPRKPNMLASCSDDHNVRIWEAVDMDADRPATPTSKGKGALFPDHSHL